MATFIVSNANDSGAGSLRQAILDANSTSGADTIDIQSGAITPSTLLPTITEQVTFDNALTINGELDLGMCQVTFGGATVVQGLAGGGSASVTTSLTMGGSANSTFGGRSSAPGR